MEPKRDKQEPFDPEAAVRQLDLELMRQRASRQQTVAYKGFRTASFIFLLVIVLAAAFAYYYVFHLGGLEELRARQHRESAPNSTELSEP